MTSVASIIQRAIASRAFPAAAVEVGRRDGVLWTAAFGRLTYAPDAAVTTPDTIFDLASLTKVIATATLMMRAVDDGVIGLEDRVADRLPEWRGADREAVTITDLLEHAAGLTAYLPFFRDHRGRTEFEHAICTLPLEYAPRSRSIYSDLGFMLLAFILEDAYRMRFAEQFNGVPRLAVTGTALDAGANRSDGRTMRDRGEPEGILGFRPRAEPPASEKARFAPTELDLWRGRLLQGEVHDENAWELGAAAGHAGLFGTAGGVGRFARQMLEGFTGTRLLAKPETLARFARQSTVPGSSRALGWDTMLPTSSCGASLTPRAIGHTGFTGTSLWIDPGQDLYVVFLTNRVHPTRENNQIQEVRRAVHDALAGEVCSS
ncbi:MAG: serine hydrolase domain-containing protein [Vicinamibacterales bacterium]